MNVIECEVVVGFDLEEFVMIKVYGIKVFYFMGKLEGYFCYKEILFEYCLVMVDYFGKVLLEKIGVI